MTTILVKAIPRLKFLTAYMAVLKLNNRIIDQDVSPVNHVTAFNNNLSTLNRKLGLPLKMPVTHIMFPIIKTKRFSFVCKMRADVFRIYCL